MNSNEGSSKLQFNELLSKFGFESKYFIEMKNKLSNTLSIDRLINNITELIHFRNYIEQENQLLYCGNGVSLQ